MAMLAARAAASGTRCWILQNMRCVERSRSLQNAAFTCRRSSKRRAKRAFAVALQGVQGDGYHSHRASQLQQLVLRAAVLRRQGDVDADAVAPSVAMVVKKLDLSTLNGSGAEPRGRRRRRRHTQACAKWRGVGARLVSV